MYFLLKEALWQTVKAAINCRKHNMTFHHGLRTFHRKALHFGKNKISKAGKTLITIKRVCKVFCWNILEIFFCKQCRLSLIWVNTVCRTTDSKTIIRSISADDMPSQFPISGPYRPASETPFGWRFACGPIVPRFYMLILGIRMLITNSSGTKTAQEILDEQPRLMRACVSRILETGMKIQFLSQIQAYSL